MSIQPWKSRLRLACVAMLLVLCATTLWQGCTVTPENYGTLSMFFDGVPDPSGKKTFVDARTGETRERINVTMHKPFEEEKCSECHDGSQVLSKQSSSICMKCHAKVTGEHERIHGPVAAVACLWCHHPHESTRPHLMRDADRKLCTQCHAPGGFDHAGEPAHLDPNRACLECHSGHGGPKPFLLLRDRLPTAAPIDPAKGGR